MGKGGYGSWKDLMGMGGDLKVGRRGIFGGRGGSEGYCRSRVDLRRIWGGSEADLGGGSVMGLIYLIPSSSLPPLAGT